MFFIAEFAPYAIGRPSEPVMRAQVSGLATSSERNCICVRWCVPCISDEEGAKNGVQPKIGAALCKSVHQDRSGALALRWRPKQCKNHADRVRAQKNGDLQVALVWESLALPLQQTAAWCAREPGAGTVFSACLPPWPSGDPSGPGAVSGWS